MIEWLKKNYKNPRYFKYGVIFLIFILTLVVFEIIALISDLGFSEEITENRWKIIVLVFIVCGLIAFIYDYRQIRSERKNLKNELQRANLVILDIQQEKDSLFRLMEAHKAEAQEDIFNRLKHIAVFSIKRRQWLKKGKVERFRVEKLSNNKNERIQIIDHTTVIINLGVKDSAMKGMQFLIQDPTDNTKYGLIRIKECFDTGSSCSIIETNHPAFWSEIETINNSEGKTEKIIVAPTNIIVPYTPFKELNPESAKQILDWIQNLEDVEL